MKEFEKELEQIDTNYPFNIPISLPVVCSNNCGISLFGNYIDRDLTLLQT